MGRSSPSGQPKGRAKSNNREYSLRSWWSGSGDEHLALHARSQCDDRNVRATPAAQRESHRNHTPNQALRVLAKVSLWLFIILSCVSCAAEVSVEGAACNLEQGHPCPEPFVCLNGSCSKLTGPVSTGCVEDTDCLAPTPACFRYGTVGICVQCSDSYPCASGVCRPNAGYTCGCTTNDDCNGGQLVCNDFGICTSCVSDSQCGPDRICNPDLNQCEIFDENGR